ncbi:MAG: OB-fold nucleic acid binding domain-containing protein [Paludibacteraceae bacterium]|nr:OB-fold nucleic acid binding domain-containing protein [Paludibacteraceae bacterium]
MKTAGNRAFTAKKKYIIIATMLIALVMISCGERPYINQPGDNTFNNETIPILIPDTEGIEISIDSALTICKSMAVNAKTGELYKLSGVVSKNTTNPMNVPGSYTNINFDLSDGTGSIACYYINNINNLPFRKNSQVPRVGSKVTVIGVLTYYQKSGSTNPPVPELTDGYLVRIDSMVAPPPFPGCPEPAEGQISASDAATKALALASGSTSTETYDVLGVVTEVLEFTDGKATYIISSDGKQFFEIYRGYGMNNSPFPGREYIQPNDTVVVHCKLKNYNGTPETNDNAPLVSTTNPNFN